MWKTRLEWLRTRSLWLRAFAAEWLRLLGLLPQHERVYRQVEEQVVGTLPPVSASATFRQELASKLALIAQSKSAGVVVIRPKPVGPSVLVGLLASALATTVAILVLVFHSRAVRRANL